MTFRLPVISSMWDDIRWVSNRSIIGGMVGILIMCMSIVGIIFFSYLIIASFIVIPIIWKLVVCGVIGIIFLFARMARNQYRNRHKWGTE